MTDIPSIIAQIRELLPKAVPGPWKYSPWHIEEAEPAVRKDGYGIVANTAGDDTAAYIALLNPTTVTALLEHIEELENLADRLKLEAQCHAMEARTANRTVYECYQAVTGGKGEPGNWNGANPVREYVARAEARLAEARAEALEEAASYHDDLAAQHNAVWYESQHHEMMVRLHGQFAAAIRALKSGGANG